MKCTNCGSDIYDNAKFCTKCGAPVMRSNNQAGGYNQNNQAGGYNQNNQAGGYNQNNQAGGYNQNNQAGGYNQNNQAGGYNQSNQSGGYNQNNQYNGNPLTNKKAKKKKPGKYILIILILIIAVALGLFYKTNVKDKNISVKEAVKTFKIKNIIPKKGEKPEADAKIEEIDKSCEEIDDNIKNEEYHETVKKQGMHVYYEEAALRALFVPRKVDENDVGKFYYYDIYGNLIFAKYIGKDKDCFYFSDNKLIRWEHSEEGADDSTVNNDENSKELKEWNDKIHKESKNFINLSHGPNNKK